MRINNPVTKLWYFVQSLFGIYNVKRYGAKGDGIADDYAAILAAITAATAGGGVVYFPYGTYLVGTTLSWVSDNLTFVGIGYDLVIIRDHANLGANPLISLTGNAGDYIQNVRFTGITFRNGTSSVGALTATKDCIRTRYVDGMTVKDCKFYESASYGIYIKFTKNVVVKYNIFNRITYAAMMVLAECENITFKRNIVDTITTQTETVCYTFATGNDVNDEGTFWCKNVIVEKNRFLNNPRWEGLDTHGGENITFRDNHIENCYIGINAALPSSGVWVDDNILKNITIENNTIIQGTGNNNGYGIVVKGLDAGTPAENVKIIGNKITGFGSRIADTIGTITLYLTKMVKILDNEIREYVQNAINLYYDNQHVIIHRNKFINVADYSTEINTAPISVKETGNFDIDIRYNISDANTVTKIPNYFIRIGNDRNSLQIEDNIILQGKQAAPFNSVSYLTVDRTAVPTTLLIQKFGDKIFTDTGNVGWYVSSPRIGYGSLDTATVILTVDITNGSNVATVKTGTIRQVPDGMNIVIAGAGATGGNLNCRVLGRTATTLILNQNASTTVTDANVTYQALTLVTA